VALVADSFHMLSDVIAIIIAYISVRWDIVIFLSARWILHKSQGIYTLSVPTSVSGIYSYLSEVSGEILIIFTNFKWNILSVSGVYSHPLQLICEI
jgi:hypothetical protein